MASGNILYDMFNKNKNRMITFDYLEYKFMNFLKLEESCDIICNHFTKMGLERDLTLIERSHYLIDFSHSKKGNQICLKIYKVGNDKFLFIFNYKTVRIYFNCQGEKSLFKKFIKSFYNSNEGVFRIFLTRNK